MSKDIPEVGDVWLYKYKEFKTEYYISAIARFKNPEYYVFVLYKNGNNQVVGRWWDKEEWEKTLLQDFTYLGKSKANIGDLFKTEKSND